MFEYEFQTVLNAVPSYIYHDRYQIFYEPVRANQKRFKRNVTWYNFFTIIIIIFENGYVTSSKTYGAWNERFLSDCCETSHRSKLDNKNCWKRHTTEPITVASLQMSSRAETEFRPIKHL